MEALKQDSPQIRKKDGSAYRFLLVDDSEFVLQVLRVAVKLMGGEVAGEALDGVSAVEVYKRVRPDLVTLDIIMPNMNGIEAVDNLMKIDPSAKIVMISSMGHEEQVRDAIIKGALYFLAKPFRPMEAARLFRNIILKYLK